MATNAHFFGALCFVGVLGTLAAAVPIDALNFRFEAPDTEGWTDRIVAD